MVVTVWSGREAKALRIGLRMTIEAFAEHLGVAVRTVAKWEAQGPKIVPTAAIQEVLDTAWSAPPLPSSQGFSCCSKRAQFQTSA